MMSEKTYKYRQVSLTLIEGAALVSRKFPKSYVYLPEDQRLSDLMNDERQFLPVYKENQYHMGDYDMMIVNKAVIAVIEEEGNGAKKKISREGIKTNSGIRFDTD